MDLGRSYEAVVRTNSPKRLGRQGAYGNGDKTSLDRWCGLNYVRFMFYSAERVWQDAVVRNTEALRLIVAQLVAMLAAYGAAKAIRVPRAVHSTVLRVLRPTESALRRLIVIAARDVKMEISPPRETPLVSKGRGTGTRRPQRLSFQLFDPRMRPGDFRRVPVTYASTALRVSFISPDPPFVPFAARPVEHSRDPEPEKQIGARRMCFRLQALEAALADLPKQARRLALWRLRREMGKRPTFTSPLRPGRPPGFRKVPMFNIDLVLDECHRYAEGVLSARRAAFANTS